MIQKSRKRRAYSEETKQSAVKDYYNRRGKSVSQIAEKYGCSAQMIYHWARNSPVPAPEPKQPTKLEIEEIPKMEELEINGKELQGLASTKFSGILVREQLEFADPKEPFNAEIELRNATLEIFSLRQRNALLERMLSAVIHDHH